MSKYDDLKKQENTTVGTAIVAILAGIGAVAKTISKSRYNNDIDRKIQDLRNKKNDLQNEPLGNLRHGPEINNIKNNIEKLQNSRK